MIQNLISRLESSADSAHSQTLLNELSRIQSSVSDQQERSQLLQKRMRQKLRHNLQTIRAQIMKVINTHSHSQSSLPSTMMSGEEVRRRIQLLFGVLNSLQTL